MKKRHDWPLEQQERCFRLRQEGWTIREIARREGLRQRQAEGLFARFAKRGIRPVRRDPWQGTLCLQEVEEVMGLRSYPGFARGWIRSGLLKAQKEGKRWVIYPGDFVEFLQVHPVAYARWRMPERVGGERNAYLPYARAVALDPSLVTSKQAARLLGISRQTVRHHVAHGSLHPVPGPAGDRRLTWFRREDVEAFRAVRKLPGQTFALLEYAVREQGLDLGRRLPDGTCLGLARALGCSRWTVYRYLGYLRRGISAREGWRQANEARR